MKRYISENEYNALSQSRMSVQEICASKHERKIQKNAALELARFHANRQLDRYAEGVNQFKRGELDIVSLIELGEQVKADYLKDVEEPEIRKHLSQFEIGDIWNRLLKRIRGLI